MRNLSTSTVHIYSLNWSSSGRTCDTVVCVFVHEIVCGRNYNLRAVKGNKHAPTHVLQNELSARSGNFIKASIWYGRIACHVSQQIVRHFSSYKDFLITSLSFRHFQPNIPSSYTLLTHSFVLLASKTIIIIMCYILSMTSYIFWYWYMYIHIRKIKTSVPAINTHVCYFRFLFL